MKATLLREVMSPLWADGWWEVDLEQGAVSPVRLDSSTDRSVAWNTEGLGLLSGGGKPNEGVRVVWAQVCVCARVYLKEAKVSRDSLSNSQAHRVSRYQLSSQQVLQVPFSHTEGRGGILVE